MNKAVLDAVRGIRGRSYPGSSVQNAVVYQEVPGTGLPFHRGGTEARVREILRHVNVGGKRVLDVGCSVGAVSGLLHEAGAEVVGVDYDDQSLEVAAALAEGRWELEQADVTLEWAEALPHYDVIVWLSQWMWAVKQHGLQAARDILHEVSRHCDTLVFESAANDGEAAIEDATQDSVEAWFHEAVIHESVKRGWTVHGWFPRRLLIATSPQIEWEGFTSNIRRASRNVVTKVFHPHFAWMAPREAKALKMLGEEVGFPRLIGHSANTVVMTWCGWKSAVNRAMLDQGMAIVEALAKHGIRHRDVVPDNLVALNGELALLDFGWCLFDDEADTPIQSPVCLGCDRESKRWGSSDAEAMAAILGK